MAHSTQFIQRLDNQGLWIIIVCTPEFKINTMKCYLDK